MIFIKKKEISGFIEIDFGNQISLDNIDIGRMSFIPEKDVKIHSRIRKQLKSLESLSREINILREDFSKLLNISSQLAVYITNKSRSKYKEELQFFGVLDEENKSRSKYKEELQFFGVLDEENKRKKD